MSGSAGPVLWGDEWERFCIQALEHRYDPRFQKVPARFRGDYGVDGYVRDEILFQCFGDEAGTSASDRRDAQHRKLDRDVPKLKKHADAIATFVGSGISAYVLLVSLLEDKSVVDRAATWTEEVRGWELPYLDNDDFSILIKDVDYLKAEWDLFYGALRQKLGLPEAEVSEADVDSWSDAQPELARTLASKLDSIVPESESARWQRKFVRHHIAELEVMDQLRAKGPIWQRVREIKDAREGTLESRRLAGSPRDDLLELCESHRVQLDTEVSSLDFHAAYELAWGAAGDWLMRCPLTYDSNE